MGADSIEKKIRWVKWDLILNSNDNGGLGVGSLAALNNALLYKWRWRICTNHVTLQVRVIKACHGSQFHTSRVDSRVRVMGVQRNITDVIFKLHSINVSDSWMRRQLGDGMDIRFWWDKWRDSLSLKVKYDRLYALLLAKEGV